MVERAVRTVREVVEDVVVVSSRPLGALPVPTVPDRIEGAGPLGGLDAALRHARSLACDGVLLVACDLPMLTTAVLRRVAAALGDHPAVAPERRLGGVEPLCAAYRVEALEAVERHLGRSARSLQALFAEIGGTVLPAAKLDAGDTLFNVNTPEERESAEAMLSRRGER